MFNPANLTDHELSLCVNEMFARCIATVQKFPAREWFSLSISCSGYTDSNGPFSVTHKAILSYDNQSTSNTGNLCVSALNVVNQRMIDQSVPVQQVTIALPAPTEMAEYADFTEVDEA